MSDMDEVRAWKDGNGDESMRQGHPAGDIDALRHLRGGLSSEPNVLWTLAWCDNPSKARSIWLGC